jgi:hypothetical protein
MATASASSHRRRSARPVLFLSRYNDARQPRLNKLIRRIGWQIPGLVTVKHSRQFDRFQKWFGTSFCAERGAEPLLAASHGNSTRDKARNLPPDRTGRFCSAWLARIWYCAKILAKTDIDDNWTEQVMEYQDEFHRLSLKLRDKIFPLLLGRRKAGR